MSIRLFVTVFLCLAWSLAISVKLVQAQPSTKERAIEERLRQPISLNFKDMPLKQALENLSLLTRVQIVPDTKILKDAKISLDDPVFIAVNDIEMKYALKLMLNPLRLTYVIENDVLLITTQEHLRQRLFKVTYNVSDLVEAVALVEAKGKNDGPIADLLKAVIQSTVAKDSWESMGGRGSIQYFPFGKALVVNQTAEAQEEIQLLLASLRKLYELSVEVEVRFVQTSPAMAKRWWNDVTQAGKSVEVVEAPKARDVVAVEGIQLFTLLEAARGDRKTVITQVPRLTLVNGQRGDVGVKELTATGWRADVQPVVTPDRRAVRLALNVENRITDKDRSIDRITKAARTCCLADGRTLVWNLGANADRQHLFVLVTPRIRVRSEEEKLFIGEQEPIPGR